MKRQNHVPFNAAAAPKRASPVYKQPQSRSVPQGFREAMLHISVQPADKSSRSSPVLPARTPAARTHGGQSSQAKWKSSFKPVGEDDDNSQDKSSPEGVDLYDPYHPASSDSEHEMPHDQDHNHSSADQENNLEGHCLSLSREWDSSFREPERQPLARRNISPETRLTEGLRLSPGYNLPERRTYGPDSESLDPPGHSSIHRPLEHRVCSPDRLMHSSSSQQFPPSYGGQRTNDEERTTIPEFRTEINTTVPPRLQQNYQHQLGYREGGVEEITPTAVTRNGNKSVVMENIPISCDLCDVELANGQELQDHLESKIHWDTMEHIQQENNYDDMAIAFLQEVLLYKSRQCSRAIENSVLQALQENDHMTKVEMFHCTACKVFLPTSASSVQTHITSQEHLSNTKNFETQQRRACLEKAETVMQQLKPHFEHFLKGGSPFE